MFFSQQFRKTLAIGLLGGLVVLPGMVAAQDKVLSTRGNPAEGAEVVSTQQVRERFDERFPGLGVTEVTTTPFPGLFEVRIGTDFLYVDQEVNYVLQGSLIDAKSRRDLTAQRVTDISRVDFSTLPLENAIKQVKGDGSRQMAVFEDPNCGYCKQLHRTLESLDNVTVYTFLFPILSQDSHTRSRNIWCAEDSAAVWKQWMVGNQQPAVAECETPIESNLALGRSLLVTGTPAIFFADGSRVNGAIPADALEKKLADASAKVADAHAKAN